MVRVLGAQLVPIAKSIKGDPEDQRIGCPTTTPQKNVFPDNIERCRTKEENISAWKSHVSTG